MKLRAKAVDIIFDGLELVSSLYDFIRRLRKGPPEEPFPLSHRDAERIAEFGRKAGHEPPQRR